MLRTSRGFPRFSLLLAATVTLLRFSAHPAHVLADREVMVGDGDTLTAIALRYYGDASFAQQIADYNHLPDANHLAAGQVLKLPDVAAKPLATPTERVNGAMAPGGVAAGAGLQAGSSAPRAGPVIQTGLATWYGPGFEGNRTKCGQVFHAADYTASSNDLPCGSVIQVTNVRDGRSVVVTVTDAGNFQHPTILDLSRAAFSALASPDTGVIEVSVAAMAA